MGDRPVVQDEDVRPTHLPKLRIDSHLGVGRGRERRPNQVDHEFSERVLGAVPGGRVDEESEDAGVWVLMVKRVPTDDRRGEWEAATGDPLSRLPGLYPIGRQQRPSPRFCDSTETPRSRVVPSAVVHSAGAGKGAEPRDALGPSFVLPASASWMGLLDSLSF